MGKFFGEDEIGTMLPMIGQAHSGRDAGYECTGSKLCFGLIHRMRVVMYSQHHDIYYGWLVFVYS
jgi:hypothetical protein